MTQLEHLYLIFVHLNVYCLTLAHSSSKIYFQKPTKIVGQP
jgi:hypothetical protein